MEGGGIEPVAELGEPLERTVGLPPEWVGAGWCVDVDLAEAGFVPGPLVSSRTSTTVPIATTRTSAPRDIENRGPVWPTGPSPGPAPIGDEEPDRSPGDSENLAEVKGLPWLSRTRSTAVSIARRPRAPGAGADRSDPRPPPTELSAIGRSVSKRAASADPSSTPSIRRLGPTRDPPARAAHTRGVCSQTTLECSRPAGC
jgi:hypothetical protein